MPAQDLTLTSEANEGATVLHVIGELDLSTVAAFDTALEQSPLSGRTIVVLSECTFIDSSALQSLVRAERTARDRGGSLALVAPSQPARRVLEVAALDRFVSVFDSLDEALASTA
jgi:anti-sigma B factor antagonist